MEEKSSSDAAVPPIELAEENTEQPSQQFLQGFTENLPQKPPTSAGCSSGRCPPRGGARERVPQIWPDSVEVPGITPGELIDRLTIMLLKQRSLILKQFREEEKGPTNPAIRPAINEVRAATGELWRLHNLLIRVFPQVPQRMWPRMSGPSIVMDNSGVAYATMAVRPLLFATRRLLDNQRAQWDAEDRATALLEQLYAVDDTERQRPNMEVAAQLGLVFAEIRSLNNRRCQLKQEINRLSNCAKGRTVLDQKMKQNGEQSRLPDHRAEGSPSAPPA